MKLALDYLMKRQDVLTELIKEASKKKKLALEVEFTKEYEQVIKAEVEIRQRISDDSKKELAFLKQIKNVAGNVA